MTDLQSSANPPLEALPAPTAPAPEPTVASSLAGLVLDLVAHQDAPHAKALCAAAGLDAAALADPDARLPRSALLRLLDAAARLAPSPAFGLRAFDQVNPGVFQLVGFVMMSSASLRQALERAVRLMPLLDESAVLTLRPEGAHERLSFDTSAAAMPALMNEAGLASLLGLCCFLSGGLGLPVLQADFPHPAPADLSAYRRLLPGATLRFDRPVMSLLLASDGLDAPLHRVSPALEQVHLALAEQRLESLRGHPVSVRVQQFIERHLRGRPPTLDEAAQALALSPRSLQRQLAREGRSFKQLLDDTRRQLAQQHLRQSQLTLKELAFALGFGETGSLHRACQRWFGMSPARYRAQAADVKLP